MPAAVRSYVEQKDLKQVAMELSSILQAYRDDFSKYRKKINVQRLQNTLDKIPQMVGKKLKYTAVDRYERAKDISESIYKLQKARIIYCVNYKS